MAIYHLSVKPISRANGRSATAAAAYRAASKIVDSRTGEIHDYTRKSGVLHSEIILPANAPEWAYDRAQLWDAVEQSENRKNARVAREFEIALPSELGREAQINLARDFAQELTSRHGCAADFSIHAPDKRGDERNHHAHILVTTRRLTADGLAEKTRELDDQKTGAEEVTRWRERWAELANYALEQAGQEARIDHRSHEARGITDLPQPHFGVAATHFERRTGEKSEKRTRWEEEAEAVKRLQAAKQELQAEAKALNASIIDLSGDLKAALEERDKAEAQFKRYLDAGAASVMEKFQQWQANKAADAEKKRQEEARLERESKEREARELAEYMRRNPPKPEPKRRDDDYDLSM